MRNVIGRYLARLFPELIAPLPPGITPDKSAEWGLFALISNLNNYSEAITAITTAGTNTTLTPAQLLIGVTKLNAGASGGFTITLPSTVSILAALGPTIPMDGTYAEPISILNNNVGQTGTVTAGDASTTLTGTMTVATNTRRVFMLTVLAGGITIAIENIGSLAL
jgi:hypothetical protein